MGAKGETEIGALVVAWLEARGWTVYQDPWQPKKRPWCRGVAPVREGT